MLCLSGYACKCVSEPQPKSCYSSTSMVNFPRTIMILIAYLKKIILLFFAIWNFSLFGSSHRVPSLMIADKNCSFFPLFLIYCKIIKTMLARRAFLTLFLNFQYFVCAASVIGKRLFPLKNNQKERYVCIFFVQDVYCISEGVHALGFYTEIQRKPFWNWF